MRSLYNRQDWQKLKPRLAGTWWSRKLSSHQTAQGAVLLSQYFEILLELKTVLSGSNVRFLENFVFIIISQCFHIARIKMYCMTLFLQLHSCPISRKYCTDLSFKSLTLFEWKYLKTLTSSLFSIPSKCNPSLFPRYH